MDRARSNDDENSLVVTFQDLSDRFAMVDNSLVGGFRHRELRQKITRGDQWMQATNVDVLSLLHGCSLVERSVVSNGGEPESLVHEVLVYRFTGCWPRRSVASFCPIGLIFRTIQFRGKEFSRFGSTFRPVVEDDHLFAAVFDYIHIFLMSGMGDVVVSILFRLEGDDKDVRKPL